MRPSYWIAAAAVVGVTAVALVGTRMPVRVLHVKAYFVDAQGLREGAEVRLAGVVVGSVSSVRVRPEMRDRPAEVVLTLNTPYVLNLPRDSIVELATAGLLGETMANIEVRNAVGPAVEDWGTLAAAPSQLPTTQQALEGIAKVLKPKPCDPSPPKEEAAPAKPTAKKPTR